jgi:hypothetical protein
MSPPLVLFPHQGLGDQFICHGLVRTLVDTQPILLLCRRQYVPTVAWMYRDHPAIGVLAIEDDADGYAKCRSFAQHGLPVKMLGYLGGDPSFSDVDYDQRFYTQAGVPFEHRWSRFGFQLEAVPQMTVPDYPFALYHHDGRFRIDLTKVSTKMYGRQIDTLSPNLFDWLPLMLAATEIHCIPSSVYLLIDSLPNFPDKPLYLHKYCRPNVTYPTHRKNWRIIE